MYETEETQQETVEQLQKTIEKYKQQEKIDKLLWRAGARNPIAVRALLDLETIGDDMHQMEEAIQALKEEEAYLFHVDRRDQPQLVGFSPSEGSDQEYDSFIRGFLHQ